MDAKRILEKNKIINEINNIEKFILHDENSVIYFKKQISNEYYTSRIVKLLANIDNNKKSIEILSIKLESVKNGDLDDQICEKYLINSLEIQTKTNDLKQKKMEEKNKNIIKHNNSRAFYEADKQSDRKNRNDKREYDKTYKYFVRTCNSIPDYMLKKLKNMPNNKGYIWRGIQCFGEKSAEKGKPIVLFEKQNGVLVIHEITKYDYKIWHKKDRNPKKLFLHEKRIPKNDFNNQIKIK
jgi:hypothetical protein